MVSEAILREVIVSEARVSEARASEVMANEALKLKLKQKKLRHLTFNPPAARSADHPIRCTARLLLACILVCVVCLAATAMGAANPPVAAKAAAHPASHPPNILLITLDTTRADRMGFLGSDRGLTPNLDALARQSAVFTRAYAQFPLTPASHATILTGTYPQFHHVNEFRVELADDLPYAPAILKAHGYHTAAIIGSIILEPRPPYAPGFDRGFDTYDAAFHNEGPGEDRYSTVQRRGSEVVARALAWLSKHPSGPFFLWVHLYDAHDPYDPPEPYKSKYASQPYDGTIAYEDEVVGKFMRELKSRGLYDNTIMAVTADHGESLGAHGEDTHGIFLYDETIRVPLVIKLPRPSASPIQIENRVELVDVLPTILQAAAIAVPGEVQGHSLLGLMTAKSAANPADAWTDRPAYAESDYPHNEFHWSALQSLRTGKYLYVQAPRRELYDELADPTAEHNLAPQSSAVADTLAGQLSTFRQKTASLREAPTMAADPSAQEKLGALGYLASNNSSSKTASTGEPDPKDKVEVANLLHRAEVLEQTGQHSDEAIAMLEQLIAKEPELSLYGKLGEWYMRQKQYQKALPALRKAMEMDRDSPMAHFQLAKALMATDDLENATEELEITEARMPQLADVHFLLEIAYSGLNRVPDTIRECQMVLSFAPDHAPSYFLLGKFLAQSGDYDGAIPNLKKAAALEPNQPDPHASLADVYEHLGRKSDAARERAEAKRLATARGPMPPGEGKSEPH